MNEREILKEPFSQDDIYSIGKSILSLYRTEMFTMVLIKVRKLNHFSKAHVITARFSKTDRVNYGSVCTQAFQAVSFSGIFLMRSCGARMF